MLIREMLGIISGITCIGNPEVELQGIAYDSRRVEAGDLFIALKGEKTDGALYVAEALSRGAAAVASDHDLPLPDGIPALRVPDARKFLAQASRSYFDDPASQLELVAVTGTNGKTTTAYLVDAILRQTGTRTCLVGTLGMKAGDQPFPSAHTTPEASDLTAFLRRAVQAGCTHGTVEVSSHALAMKRVFDVRFAVAVYTNLTPEHLDFHRDMESYYEAKRLLFVPEGGNRIGRAVVNAEDPYGRRLADEVPVPVLRYGTSAPCDLRLLESTIRIDGTDLRLETPEGEITIHTALVGLPNVYNIMAATGASLSLGLSRDAIRLGIESLSGVPGRMELVRCGQDFTVVVDYAHTPDALQKLLETVRQCGSGRILTVFGCGGDRDRAKRPLMGEVASRLSDSVIATSDNPRNEEPMGILAEIQPGLKNGPAPYRIEPDRREAIREALARAGKGDVVVIAGKGHENYQIIGAKVLSFDDRAVVREFLQQKTQAPGG
jgi:UDP-N-acetylmuramoyl-L-alanyl-D-glutamate--2,6-diaminopimelate ligase